MILINYDAYLKKGDVIGQNLLEVVHPDPASKWFQNQIFVFRKKHIGIIARLNFIRGSMFR